MKTKTIAINKLIPNPTNPRVIKDHAFDKLVQSVKDFPDMLKIRPVVVNPSLMVLGGNMRLKACIEAGIREIPVIINRMLTFDPSLVVKRNGKPYKINTNKKLNGK